MMHSFMRWVFVCLLVSSSALADTLAGRVVGVADGDTLTVLVGREQVKIRLMGIDAPEKRQAFGQVSKRHLSDLVFGKSIDVEWHKRDKYGRTLGKVLIGGADMNLAMVEAGLAWHYKAYEREQGEADRRAYAEAEKHAREARKGLWVDLNPVPPWDWRASKKPKP